MNSGNERSGRLVPYLWALGAIVPTYIGALYVTDQRMLAVILGAVAALTGFVGCRLIQLRGKLSLAILAIGLPLLASLVLTTMHHLQPFVQRERSISILRGTQMQFRARSASQAGEWQRDQSGNMLPTWVANRIGPDCLSELTTISGPLSEFQSVRFRDIDRSGLSRIVLHRSFHDSPPVTPEIVDWLNGIDSAYIQFTLLNYTSADSEGLAAFKNEYHLAIRNVDRYTGNLSSLKTTKSLYLHGDMLSEEQARQLAQLSATQITLDGFRLSSNVVACLHNESASDQMGLSIHNTSIDAPTLHALLRLPDRGIVFRNVSLATLRLTGTQIDLRTAGDVDDSSFPSVFAALVHRGDPTIFDVHRLVGLIRCERLHLDLVVSEEDVESLWKFSCLKQVHVRNPKDNKWTEHARKDDLTQ